MRIGRVTDVKEGLVRVLFPDDGAVSDYLRVLKRPVDGADGFEPKIGDAVLCLYFDGFGAEGIVAGCL